MKTQSSKERIYWRSPRANIVLTVRIPENVGRDKLKAAVQSACLHHAVLSYHMEQDSEGRLWYVSGETKALEPRYISCADWRDAALTEARSPLDAEKGEFIRVTLLESPERRLLLTQHHLAGDGVSAALLMGDILRALNSPLGDTLPLRLFDGSKVPRGSRPSLPLRLMVKGVNGRWRKSVKNFGKEEYEAMRARYWDGREERLETASIECGPLLAACRASGVTVTHALLASLLASDKCGRDIGVAVSLREAGDAGLGNYATGVTVKEKYNDNLSFFENARRVGDSLARTLQSEREKYFLYHFMGLLEPTLIDAAYFSAYGSLDDPLASKAAAMFGWGADRGLSLSNLGSIQLNGAVDAYFMSPLMPGTETMISAVTVGDSLNITCQYAVGQARSALLDRAAQLIQNAIGEEKL